MPTTAIEKKVSDKTGRDNLAAFSAGAGFNDTGEEMYSPFLPHYACEAQFLNVTPEEFGLIEGIAEAVNRILRFFTGALSDRLGRKVPVVLGYILIALSRLGLPLVKGWLGLIPLRGLRQVGRALRDPAREASIAESIPKEKRGRAFGLLNAVDTMGAILGPIIGLLILTSATDGHLGLRMSGSYSGPAYRWVFMWAAIPTIISSWIIWLFLVETKQKKPPDKTPYFQQLFSNLKSYLADKPLFRITLAHMTLALGVVPLSMILFYAYSELGASNGQGAILFITFAIVHFLASYPAGAAVDRFGRYHTQMFGSFLCVLALIIVIVANHPLLLLIPMVLYAIFLAIWIAARRATIADLAPENMRAQTLGTFSMFYGLSALMAPMLVGFLWRRVSPSFAFVIMALICGVSIIMFWRRHKIS